MVGHVFRIILTEWEDQSNGVQKSVLRETYQGKEKRRRPKMTGRRSIEAELKDTRLTLGTAEVLAKGRPAWRLKVVKLSNRKAVSLS